MNTSKEAQVEAIVHYSNFHLLFHCSSGKEVSTGFGFTMVYIFIIPPQHQQDCQVGLQLWASSSKHEGGGEATGLPKEEEQIVGIVAEVVRKSSKKIMLQILVTHVAQICVDPQISWSCSIALTSGISAHTTASAYVYLQLPQLTRGGEDVSYQSLKNQECLSCFNCLLWLWHRHPSPRAKQTRSLA